MVDTIRLEWKGLELSEGFYAWLLSDYPTMQYQTSAYSETHRWQGSLITDPILGTIGTKSNRVGNYLWVEKSIPKFLYGDNSLQLSHKDAEDGIRHFIDMLETKFEPWFKMESPKDSRSCKRIDFYYQQKVNSSAEIFTKLRGILKGKNIAIRSTGIEIHQSKFEHARFYDKGEESKKESFLNVIRHEEQLRGSKIQEVVDIKNVKIDRDVVRILMNRRFLVSTTIVETYNFDDLLEEHGFRGAAAIGLILMPELAQTYKRNLSKDGYYRCKKVADEVLAKTNPTDLRVPANAWEETVPFGQ